MTKLPYTHRHTSPVTTLSMVVALLLLVPAKASRDQPLLDGDFELQTGVHITSPWITEGHNLIQVEANEGSASSGTHNVFIAGGANQWNAITQFFKTVPLAEYMVSADVWTASDVHDGYFGVRDEVGRVIQQVKFGPLARYNRVQFNFRAIPRQTGVNLFIGFSSPGGDTWIRVDHVHVAREVHID